MKYPIAADGVFLTIQGEGVKLRGLPMVFVRLAGCSVGCEHCDTDYRVLKRVDVSELVREILSVATPVVEWVWVTGGEPTEHDLSPLTSRLRYAGLKVAIATSGVREVTAPYDFLSVSPHDPSKWVQQTGDQLNLVPSLNGFSLRDFDSYCDDCETDFADRFVTPCDGATETLAECLEWVYRRRGWRLGHQDHKHWGLK